MRDNGTKANQLLPVCAMHQQPKTGNVGLTFLGAIAMQPIILQLIGLSANADHELDVSAGKGLIYITLAEETDTTDEVWASIAYSFDHEVSHHAGEVWHEDGYSAIALRPYSEIDDVYNIEWQVDEVEGGNWTPSDADKAKIDEIICDYVLEHGDEQIEQCSRYQHY